MKNKFYFLALLAVMGITTTTVSCNSDDSIENISSTPSKLTVKLSGDNIASVKV